MLNLQGRNSIKFFVDRIGFRQVKLYATLLFSFIFFYIQGLALSFLYLPQNRVASLTLILKAVLLVSV